MTRRPVGVATHAWADGSGNGGERCVVVCDDGAAFVEAYRHDIGAHWTELPPIPGTARDREMRDDPPGGAR